MNLKGPTKIILALLLSFLIGVGGYFIYQRFLRKEPLPGPGEISAPEISSVLPEGESFKAVSIRFSKDLFDKLPRSLAVYESTPVKADFRDWAERFRFADPGNFEDEAWVWEKEGTMFKFYPERNYLEYFTPAVTEGNALSLEELKATALRTISDYNLYDEGENPEVFETTYFGALGYEIGETSSFDEADFTEFKISPRLSSLPVISDSYPFYLSAVQLTKDGNLSALTHHLFSTPKEVSGKYPLKDFQTVVENLESGQGKVISIEGLDFEIPHPSSLALYQIEIAYLRPEKGEDVIQPVFILEGQAEFQEGKWGNVQVLLPALKER